MDLLYHHAEYGGAWASGTAEGRVAGGGKFDVFMSVTLLHGKVCVNNFAIKAYDCGNAFDTVGEGKVCS